MNVAELLTSGVNGYRKRGGMSFIHAPKNGTKEPSFLEKVTDLGKEVKAAVSTSYADLQSVVQSFKDEKITLFSGNVRSQHLKDILSVPADMEVSPGEKKARKNLTIASGSLALAVAGSMIFPSLYLVSAFCGFYLFRVFFRPAYRALVEQRRIDMNGLTVLIMVGSLVGGLFLAAAVAIWFAMLNDFLVVKTEDQSKKGLVNLFGEQPRTVWVLVDGIEVEVPFEDIEVGDIVLVNAGQAIPIDGTIAKGIASIDQHTLTGEAQPVEKGVGDQVFAATVMLSGKIAITVETTGSGTVAAQIGHVLEQTTDYRQSMQKEWVNTIEKFMLPMLALGGLALPAAGLSGALAVLWYYPGYRMLVFGPLSMLSFLHVAAQRGVLIKDGRSLESLGKVDTIVFDKTGTLTMEQPHVGRIYSREGLSEVDLLTYAAAAEHRQTHPIARAILAEVDARGLSLPSIDDAHYEVGYGIKVRLHGRTVRVGSDRFMGMEGIDVPADIRQLQAECHAQGHSLVMVALDDGFAGAIELYPTIRPEAKEIINQLHARNLELIIISGDHDAPTRHLAQELGIDRYFAEVLPADKAELVKQLQAEGRSVCFVGDGINDAIALKTANVSISLRGATTIAIDTAQIVLMDESIHQLEQLFEVVEDFDANMKFNFMASTIPSLIGIGCTFLFGWGFLAAGILVQVTTPVAVYNTLRPLFVLPPKPDAGLLETID